MNTKVDRYAVFGNPIKHSKSPQIHTLFAEQTKQALIYSAELAEIGKFDAAVNQFIQQGGKGINITVPFKEDAWQLATSHSKRALRAGAVNTLKLQDDGSLFGDTTDGCGLVSDLLNNHNIQLANKKILIIGAGGAVRGALQAILEQQPTSLLVCNRTASKAIQLAEDFSDLGSISGCALQHVADAFDVIINGTSASLHGEIPQLPDSIFKNGSCSYDMMYGATATPFMQWSAKCNAAIVLDGLGMLVEQAAESFYLWRGIKPETPSVIKTIRQSLIS